MKAEFVSAILTDAALAELSHDLDAVLPGASPQRGEFIEAASDAVDSYFVLLLPMENDAKLWPDRLDALIKTATAFGDALARLGDTLSDQFEQDAVIAARKHGADPDAAAAIGLASGRQLRESSRPDRRTSLIVESCR